MNTKGRYYQMDLAQRTAWVQEFTQFYDDELPLLERQNDTPNERLFNHGLALLEYFDIARVFVDNCRRFGQYRQRLTRMRFMADTVRTLAMQSVNVAQLLADRTQEAVRKGRPAVAEAAALATERGLNALATEHCTAVAALGGQKKRGRGRPPKSEKAAQERAMDTGNGAAATPAGNGKPAAAGNGKPATVLGDSIAEPPCRQQPLDLFANETLAPAKAIHLEPGDERCLPHLRDLAWLMPEWMAQRVNNLADTRRTAESEGAVARALANGKASEDEMLPHVQAVVDSEKAISQLYADIDNLMAHLHLAAVSGTLDEHTQRGLRAHGLSATTLADMLRPYWEKMQGRMPSHKPQETPCCQKKDPRVRNLKKYLTRNDVPLSEAYLRHFQQNIDELEALGEDCDAYRAKLELKKKELAEKTEATEPTEATATSDIQSQSSAIHRRATKATDAPSDPQTAPTKENN